MAKKKINLKTAQITDGQMRTPDSNGNIKTIDDILGITYVSPFKAQTEEELKKNLAEMNLTDMQAMATKVGLLPIHDRTVLHQRICAEFRKDYRRKHPSDIDYIESNQNLNHDKASAARAILAQGK